MKELSLHIMDLIENGINAEGSLIRLTIDEAVSKNKLTIKIEDNGKGVSPEMLSMMIDPFVTTRTTRRVGMGLSLMKAAAERCDGQFHVASKQGKGTQVRTNFRYDHIDRAPLGDIATSLISILAGYPEIDIVYTHMYDDKSFEFDTKDIRGELDGIPLNEPAVLQHLKRAIKNELEEIRYNNKDA